MFPLSKLKPYLRHPGVIIPSIFLLVLIGIIVVAASRPRAQSGNRGKMPVQISIADARSGDIDVTLDALGTVIPLETVTVRTQIAGQLVDIAFTEGQMVKKGDYLAQIDPRPSQAQLEQSEGQLKRDQALLHEAEINLERYRILIEEDSIARQTYDNQLSQVEQYKGTVVMDQAQVSLARLNLAYCHIVAPIDGRVGLRKADLGNYLQASDSNGIVTITRIHPISVLFTIAEDNLSSILASSRGRKELTVTAYDRSGKLKLASGKLSAIDNEIDTGTGTVKLRAMFDNKDDGLFPNQFVNVSLLVDTHQNAVLTSAAAIQHGQEGNYVYLLQENNTVTIRQVKTGIQTSETVEVINGLQSGDRVVTSGIDKLREGIEVVIAK